MDITDRAFLNNYAQFGFMNHVASSIALARCLVEPATLAAELRWRVENIPLPDAQAMAKKLNDTPRIQKIMFAKLIVEYLGAMEAFGAFCDAIQYRTSAGIYARFVSSTEEVTKFFDYVLAHFDDDLGQLLRLPTLEKLAEQLPSDILADIESGYRDFPERIHLVARTYRRTASPPVHSTPSNELPEGWESDLNVLLGPPGSAAKIHNDKRGVFVLAANKLKHRFTVVEDLELFAEPRPVGQAIPFVQLSMDFDFVTTLYDNIRVAAMSTADLAALLILLDQHGVEL